MRPYKILIINFGQMGDVVLSTAAMRAIRQCPDSASVTLLLGTSSLDVAEMADAADHYIAFDRKLFKQRKYFRGAVETLRLLRTLRRERFDLVIDFFSRSETNLLGFLAGIPKRLYAARNTRSIDSLSNFKPAAPPFDPERHIADRCFDLAECLVGNVPREPFIFRPKVEDVEAMRKRFPSLDGAVGVFPGAGHPSRRWSLEKYGELAKRISKAGIVPALFLGPEESDAVDRAENYFPASTLKLYNLGQRELVPAMRLLAAMVGNDTGTTHLAAQTGIKVVLVVDQNAELIYVPLSNHLYSVKGRRLADVDVSDVFEALCAALSE